MNTKLFNGLACFALSLCVCSPAGFAQDDDATTPPPAEESATSEERIPELFEFDTSGFSFDLELFQPPVVRETSNNSLYAVTIQRRAPDGLPLGTDGLMAFVRLTQTIDPIKDNGTIEDLHKATIEDAMRSINNAYGDLKHLESIPCSYEILGEVREGTRINVGYLQIGVNVYVECYSFMTESGNGVGITIKYHEPDGEEIPRDALLADQILSGLDIHAITPESNYINSLNGYPIRIPVRSSIKGSRKVNKFVTEATIAYLNGSLRFQMIEIPEGADGTRVARDQLRGYEMALGQQRDRGQIEIMWDAHSSVPAGEHAEAVLPGLMHAIRMNDQEFLSTMYAAVDDQRVIVANFSGSIEHADTLSEYARDFFKRPFSTAKPSNTLDDLGGAVFARPSGLEMERNQSGDPVYAPTHGADSYTIARVINEPTTINAALENAYPDGFTADSAEAPVTDLITLDDGREVQSLLVTGNIEDESGSKRSTSITGYLVPILESETQVLLVAVSPTQAHTAQNLVTREFLDRFEADSNSSIDLGYATLDYDDAFMSRTALKSGRDEIIVLSSAGSLMTRTIPLADDRERTMESLNPAFLIPAWVAANPSETEGESDSIEVTDTQFHGMNASMIENAQSRVIGFMFNDSYVVITAQSANESRDALDALISLISSN